MTNWNLINFIIDENDFVVGSEEKTFTVSIRDETIDKKHSFYNETFNNMYFYKCYGENIYVFTFANKDDVYGKRDALQFTKLEDGSFEFYDICGGNMKIHSKTYPFIEDFFDYPEVVKFTIEMNC